MSGARRPPWARIAGFAALILAAIGGGGLYLAKALQRHEPASAVPLPPSSAPSNVAPAPGPVRATVTPVERARPDASAAPVAKPSTSRIASAPVARVTSPATPPSIMFRITAHGEAHGRLGVRALAGDDQLPKTTALSCERIHFAVDRGVCLTAERRMFGSYGATVFDRDFRPLHQLRLGGVPSRVRVAPDGRLAAITVFVSGHSYAASDFSTRTSFVDLRTGEVVVENMETFTVRRDGDIITAPDFNFWGVTFARDGNRFYATLGTRGQTYLIEGDLERRAARVVRAGVECPALSPDNTRVAFKKRTGGVVTGVSWRLSVLELGTGMEWELAERRSVDDQVEWLDDRQILYGLLTASAGTVVINIWTVPGDGSGEPQLLVPGAASPVVIRAGHRAGER